MSQITNSVTQVLLALVPSLGPYGAVIGMSMSVAETVAPEIYEEIKCLISKITDGHEPTDAEVSALMAKIADLKKPDVFFQIPLPVTVEAGKDVTVQIPAAAPAPTPAPTLPDAPSATPARTLVDASSEAKTDVADPNAEAGAAGSKTPEVAKIEVPVNPHPVCDKCGCILIPNGPDNCSC